MSLGSPDSGSGGGLSPAEWGSLLRESGLLGSTAAKLTCLKAIQVDLWERGPSNDPISPPAPPSLLLLFFFFTFFVLLLPPSSSSSSSCYLHRPW